MSICRWKHFHHTQALREGEAIFSLLESRQIIGRELTSTSNMPPSIP